METDSASTVTTGKVHRSGSALTLVTLAITAGLIGLVIVNRGLSAIGTSPGSDRDPPTATIPSELEHREFDRLDHWAIGLDGRSVHTRSLPSANAELHHVVAEPVGVDLTGKLVPTVGDTWVEVTLGETSTTWVRGDDLVKVGESVPLGDLGSFEIVADTTGRAWPGDTGAVVEPELAVGDSVFSYGSRARSGDSIWLMVIGDGAPEAAFWLPESSVRLRDEGAIDASDLPVGPERTYCFGTSGSDDLIVLHLRLSEFTGQAAFGESVEALAGRIEQRPGKALVVVARHPVGSAEAEGGSPTSTEIWTGVTDGLLLTDGTPFDEMPCDERAEDVDELTDFVRFFPSVPE